MILSLSDPIKELFLYNPERPLLFTMPFFWGFFVVVLLIYSLVYRSKPLRNGYLFLVSLFFYYKTGGLFFFILFFSTIIDYALGLSIYHARRYWFRRLFAAISILLNLGILCFFKYDYFLTETFNHLFGTQFEVVTHAAKWSNMLMGTRFDLGVILPPVGISFFTFQTISYTLDVYWGKIKPVRNLVDFGFYVSFFPQLVSGPIVRASAFIPQLQRGYRLSEVNFGRAIFFILNGLIKKIVVGDYLAVNLIDRVFANPATFTGFENLLALYGYSIQIYCDFSGYTDIAIGVALLMGFKLPVNFDSPYKATNVGDFWKRWHISLSSWLKDYLYIPLGGNRGGTGFTYLSLGVIALFVILLAGSPLLMLVFALLAIFFFILSWLFPGFRLGLSTQTNIMVTMLLGGLWHGASWNFVLWGGLNGIGLLFFKAWKRISPYEKSRYWAIMMWKIFITFHFITFTRIWFRGESFKGTMEMLDRMLNHFNAALIPAMTYNYRGVILIMLFGYVVHWLPNRVKAGYRKAFVWLPVWAKILVCVLVVFVLYQAVSAELQPFIYFRF